MQLRVQAEAEGRATAADRATTLMVLGAVLALSLFLQNEFQTKQALLFLIGAGLGVTLYHASFGFTSGWRHFIREGRSDSVQAQIMLLALTSAIFIPIFGGVFEGLKASPAVGPVGTSVLIGAFLFGIGMQLGGGCGSGTLFTVGGGHVKMLITLAFFIVGATLGSMHLHWWLALPSFGRISLVQSLGWQGALALQLALLAGLLLLVRWIDRRLRGETTAPRRAATESAVVDKLIYGPWPLWWGVAGLTLFGAFTLLVAGHPWSITFAFGLWGAKIASALGVDVASWTYWSSGYPAAALSRSVLADTTSLMDFGLILGAVLAASLAGKFAPKSHLDWHLVVTAVIGGLLLGYGARLGFGCNIGALLAGIASGSVHGWLWLASAFLGGILGVRLRIMFHLDEPVRRKR